MISISQSNDEEDDDDDVGRDWMLKRKIEHNKGEIEINSILKFV